jgi:hypothetical protein
MYILNFKYFEVRKKVKGLTIPFGFQYACIVFKYILNRIDEW